mgnify:CR=1 FL=1
MAVATVKEIFPDAKVTPVLGQRQGRDTVIVKCSGIEIANVAQRDLYRKYGWPAKKEIVARLQAFKEEMEN